MTNRNYNREVIVNLLKNNRQLKLAKIEELKKEIILDWKKYLLLRQDTKNLRRKIFRQRILLRTLQDIKE